MVQKERRGGCCLVPVASWIERVNAGQDDARQCIASWWDNENGYFLSFWVFLSLELQWATQKDGAGMGVESRKRMINTWRQARRLTWRSLKKISVTEGLEQTGRGSVKTTFLQVFSDTFLVIFFSAEAELALLPVWSVVSHAPMQTLSCPFSSVAALV